MGKRLADLIVPERFRDAHIAGLKRYLETGEAHVIGKRLELPAMRKDGSEFLSELTITRSDLAGSPAFTGVLRDITSRKESEAEREQLIKALARSNQELDQFAYVASHDLKAPLRGIANLSQWIEEDLGEKLGGENKSQMGLLRGFFLWKHLHAIRQLKLHNHQNRVHISLRGLGLSYLTCEL
jgi:signal transduction histidine kinase